MGPLQVEPILQGSALSAMRNKINHADFIATSLDMPKLVCSAVVGISKCVRGKQKAIFEEKDEK